MIARFVVPMLALVVGVEIGSAKSMHSLQSPVPSSAEQLFVELQAILKVSPLQIQKVEEITGLRFTEDRSLSRASVQVFVASAAQGPLEGAEIRIPNRFSKQADGILTLRVNPAMAVHPRDVLARFGPVSRLSAPPENPSANVPDYYTYLRPEERLAFGFARQDAVLVSIVIDRTRPVR